MKLVRDRIPEIIIEDGRTPIYHIADKEEYKRELFRKVKEELAEFREDPCVEEVADLVEVVYALLEAHNIRWLKLYGKKDWFSEIGWRVISESR